MNKIAIVFWSGTGNTEAMMRDWCKLGFIENQGRNFTCCGFWKSYGDPAEMQACFDCYRKCIQTYVAMFEQGIPIERLAVPA